MDKRPGYRREQLTEAFLRAYHMKEPGLAIKEFLDKNFPGNLSRHLAALYNFARIVTENKDAPGMVWGMMNQAWTLFMNEVYGVEK